MDKANGVDNSPSAAVEGVREDIERMGITSRSGEACSRPEGTAATASAAAASAKEDKADVVSEEVCQSIKKGMKIVSDVEQTRADGTCFKFEVDLMYAVSKRALKPTQQVPCGGLRFRRDVWVIPRRGSTRD